MKKIIVVLGLFLITAMIIVPVIATDQSTVATQNGGTDNNQVTISTDTNNYYKSDQDTSASQSGDDNTQITTSNTIYTEGGSVGATSVSNNQQVVFVTPPPASYDNSLSLEDTNDALTTLYSGQVIAITIGEMRVGQSENLTWKSGMPMLVEAIRSADVQQALHDRSSAPVYDDIYQYYNHNHLYILPASYLTSINEGFSRQNEIVFTAPKDGSYTFIVDSRPGNHRDGQIGNGQISDNTIDFDYSMLYAGYNPVAQPLHRDAEVMRLLLPQS